MSQPDSWADDRMFIRLDSDGAIDWLAYPPSEFPLAEELIERAAARWGAGAADHASLEELLSDCELAGCPDGPPRGCSVRYAADASSMEEWADDNSLGK